MTPNKKQELKIEVPESVADGSYSNFSIISHSGAEFIIDFAALIIDFFINVYILFLNL